MTETDGAADVRRASDARTGQGLRARVLRLVSVEDSPDDAELIRLALRRHGLRFDLAVTSDEAGFRRQLEAPVDAVLCDYSLPTFSPYRALELLAARQPGVPLVVVTRAIGEETAVALLRAGARDYFLKSRLDLVAPGVERVLRECRLERERERMQARLEEAYARLSRVSRRLVDAQEHERARIARALHDDVGQTLTAVVLQLQAAARSGERAQVDSSVEAALALAREAVEQVRLMSFSLNPPQFEMLGLSAALRAAVERLATPAGVAVRLELIGREPEAPQPTWISALRIAQEAVVNAIRHGRPTTIRLRLRFGPLGGLAVAVADDGRGFDVRSSLRGGVRDDNFGLYGMLERAELAGGRLRIVSRPGRGAAVLLRLPSRQRFGGVQ